MSRYVYIPDLDFFPIPDPDHGSRVHKSTGSQIRIRNTVTLGGAEESEISFYKSPGFRIRIDLMRIRIQNFF
jgi:hypothetical protein